MRAPFPYFGGKFRASPHVWAAFGNVDQYIEPFAGSLAVLLNRPVRHLPAKGELVNDLDGQISNVWRSIKRHPDEVAYELGMLGPSDELTLTAIGREVSATRDYLTEKLRAEVAYCDPILAARWIWGAGCSIGALNNHNESPVLDGYGHGIRSLANRDRIPARIAELSERLKNVSIICGDWGRTLTRAAITPSNGNTSPTAIFLDPPYAGCSKGLYTKDKSPSAQVAQWCREQTDPRLRIILCGIEGEHDALGWRTIKYKLAGHASKGKGGAKVDCIYLSPSCINATSPLFPDLIS